MRFFSFEINFVSGLCLRKTCVPRSLFFHYLSFAFIFYPVHRPWLSSENFVERWAWRIHLNGIDIGMNYSPQNCNTNRAENRSRATVMAIEILIILICTPMESIWNGSIKIDTVAEHQWLSFEKTTLASLSYPRSRGSRSSAEGEREKKIGHTWRAALKTRWKY